MAEELKIIVSATDKASPVLHGIGKAAGDLGGLLGGALKLGAVGAAAGIGVLSAALIKGIGNASQQEDAEAKLTAALKAGGNAARLNKDELLKLASAYQTTTKFTDDQVISAEAVLARFHSLGTKEFPQALAITLDLATAMGTDATSAATALGKALEDPGEGLMRLKAAGVAFSDTEIERIKLMKESGDVAGAQKLIMDELAKTVGGNATIAAGTFSGQMTILKNSFDESLESLGAGFLPKLTEAVKFLNQNAVPAFQGLIDVFVNGKEPLGDWSSWWEKLNAMFGEGVADTVLDFTLKLKESLDSKDWTPVIDSLLSFINKAGDAIGAKALYLIVKFNEWSTSEETQAQLSEVGSSIGKGIVEGIKALVSRADTSEGIGNAIVTSLKTAILSIPKNLSDIGGGIAAGLISGFVEWITGKEVKKEITDTMQYLASGMIQDMYNFTRAMFNPLELAKMFSSNPFPTHRASGGGLGAGEMSVVGERGPELFIPNSSGQIIPNHLLGGGGGNLTFVYAPSGISFGDEREARERMVPILDEWYIDARRRQVGS